jgi:hypothetical protein
LTLAKNTGQSFGVAEQSWVLVPHPMGMLPLQEIRAKADTAFPEILKAATQWRPSGAKLQTARPVYPAEIIDFEGTEADVNDLFFKNGWSLGVPIIPPTPERVQAMLKGTSHKPGEVIGLVPPRVAAVTVELVAIHAVMAGCKPEQLPILLAVASVLTSEDYRSGTTTTHPTAPYVIINGPIRDKVGIAYGVGAAGPEQRANVALGLAIQSIGDVIGGSKPPDGDKTTLGWPGNTIAFLIGENEAANPWGPLSVEKGFKKDENVVTVQLGGDIPSNINDHDSVKGVDLLRVIANDMRRVGQNSRFMGESDVMVIISPEHATTLFEDGWKTKDDIRKFLWENARNPLKTFPGGGNYEKYGVGLVSKGMGVQANLDTLVPIVKNPSFIQIVVSGGPGKHSLYFGTGPSGGKLLHIPLSKWQ